MADPINFIFFNVELFPLWEIIIWLLFFILIYIIYCVVRKVYDNGIQEGRFGSISRQFAHQRVQEETSSQVPFGNPVVYQNPLHFMPNTSPSAASPSPSSESGCSRFWTSCSECSHPRNRLKRLPRHLLFVAISYFLLVLAAVIFAVSIETQIVIDPHPCQSKNNETEVFGQKGPEPLDESIDDPSWYCNYTFQQPHEVVWLKGKGGADLHGWWMDGGSGRNNTNPGNQTNGKSVRTFLIVHGRSLPIPVYKPLIKQLVDFGHNVFIFDYRGFGKSTGVPTEQNMNEDSAMVLEYVAKRQNIPTNEVVPMGVSLGGSIATNLATKFNTTSLALISSIDSIYSEIKSNLKFTWWGVVSAMHSKFDTGSSLRAFKGCLFFYVGGLDDIIPAWRGWRLHANANSVNVNCSYAIEDPKAGHCGMPGSIFDDDKVTTQFKKWTNS